MPKRLVKPVALRYIAGERLEDAVGVFKSHVSLGNALVIKLELPTGLIVFSLAAVSFILAAGIAREQPVKVSRPLVVGIDEVRGIGVFRDIGHVVVAGIAVNIIKHVFNHAVDEGDVSAGTQRAVDISSG